MVTRAPQRRERSSRACRSISSRAARGPNGPCAVRARATSRLDETKRARAASRPTKRSTTAGAQLETLVCGAVEVDYLALLRTYMAVTRSLFVRAPTILTRDVMSTPRSTSRCSAYIWRLLVSCCWRPAILTRHIIPTPRSTSRCSAAAPSTRTVRRARRTSRRAMQPPCNRHVTVTCEKRDTRRGESSGDDGGGGGARATR